MATLEEGIVTNNQETIIDRELFLKFGKNYLDFDIFYLVIPQNRDVFLDAQIFDDDSTVKKNIQLLSNINYTIVLFLYKLYYIKDYLFTRISFSSPTSTKVFDLNEKIFVKIFLPGKIIKYAAYCMRNKLPS